MSVIVVMMTVVMVVIMQGEVRELSPPVRGRRLSDLVSSFFELWECLRQLHEGLSFELLLFLSLKKVFVGHSQEFLHIPKVHNRSAIKNVTGFRICRSGAIS